MARIDKYEPKAGGFRAPLAEDLEPGQRNTLLGVGLDADGRVVIGSGNTGIVGVLLLTTVRRAGDVVDVMTDGEVVEAGLSAGTVYYAAADGSIGTTDTDTRIGHTVEADRVVVRLTH